MHPIKKSGMDWDAAELHTIIVDYFAMLTKELAGQHYTKSRHHQALTAQLGRTRSSIEYKHQNISAILQELGFPWIEGYKPYGHYQKSLIPAIERYLTENPLLLSPTTPSPKIEHDPETYFAAPPALPENPEAPPPELQQLIRKFDPVARDFRNRALGRAGEEFVLHLERKRLTAARRQDLAQRVRWVAAEDGDGAGYDVHSFHPDGRPRLLEVKTTNGPARLPFYLTRNELQVSEANPISWCLYRVHLFATTPRILELHPPLPSSLRLTPETWRAQLIP